MEQARLTLLLYRYKNDLLSPSEKVELNDWFHSLNLINKDFERWLKEESLPEVLFQDFKTKINEKQKTVKVIRFNRIAAAASVLLIVSLGLTWYFNIKQIDLQVAQTKNLELSPGGNKAILTLGDGKQIILANAKNGRLAVEGDIQIDKKADGQVIYSSNASTIAKTAANTLTTPMGGKYNLTLADGTKVWLNAASSIKYPSAFTGKTRVVEVKGEAYFEVEHNAARPFIVVSRGQSVQVLGTRFNINAYDNETVVKTTLLEGSIKISKGGHNALLKPGQQAQADENNGFTIFNDVDAEGAVAWKDGFFHYKDTDIRTIMRAYARWYNVIIEYEGDIPTRTFTIDINRNVNASQALKILTYLKINCRIEGKKIIIIDKK